MRTARLVTVLVLVVVITGGFVPAALPGGVRPVGAQALTAPSSTTVTNNITVSSSSISLGSVLEARGQVSADGKPLPNASVALHMGDITVANTQTDQNGRYAFSVPVGANYFPAAFSNGETVYTVVEPHDSSFVDTPSAPTSVPVNLAPLYAIIALITAAVVTVCYLFVRRFNEKGSAVVRAARPSRRVATLGSLYTRRMRGKAVFGPLRRGRAKAVAELLRATIKETITVAAEASLPETRALDQKQPAEEITPAVDVVAEKPPQETPAPSDVRQIGTVTKYELIKHLHGRRLLAIVLLTIIISAIFLIAPPASGSQYPKDPKEFMINIITFLAILSILSATFFGADAIVSEYESKTGYFLFPNPIRKTAIFLGKFIASALVSVGAIGLYYVIAVVSVRVIYGSTPANTGLSFAYSLVYLFAILAIAYLFSAVMRSSVYWIMLTFFYLFLILPIVNAIGTIAKFKPWFSITFANGISQYIFQNPYPTDVSSAIVPLGGTQASSIPQYYPDVRLSLVVMAAYLVVAFVLSILLFERREM